MDFTHAMNEPSVEENALGQSRLASIDVSRNANIPSPLERTFPRGMIRIPYGGSWHENGHEKGSSTRGKTQ
jgi:hypothetical protein